MHIEPGVVNGAKIVLSYATGILTAPAPFRVARMGRDVASPIAQLVYKAG